jgi:protein involved in polysaccharide export with SLBB domain
LIFRPRHALFLARVSSFVGGMVLPFVLGLSSGCVETSVSVSRATPLRQFLALSRSNPQTYRCVPGDQLTTRFYFNPQLDEDLQVRPDGNISLSLIGEMRAAGKTAAELSQAITQAYAQYFVKPTAVVIVRQFTGYRIFTAGELRNPGQLSLVTGPRTVLESLASSGGVTETGTLTHVILVRRLPQMKQPMVAELDLAEAISGSDPTQDVALMPNDMVFVPRSGAADLNLALKQYLWNNVNFSSSAGFGASYNLNSSTSVVPTNTTLPPGTGMPGTTGTTVPMPMPMR